jgi:hypothetical protein
MPYKKKKSGSRRRSASRKYASRRSAPRRSASRRSASRRRYSRKSPSKRRSASRRRSYSRRRTYVKKNPTNPCSMQTTLAGCGGNPMCNWTKRGCVRRSGAAAGTATYEGPMLPMNY